jgi:hypothetical protein
MLPIERSLLQDSSSSKTYLKRFFGNSGFLRACLLFTVETFCAIVSHQINIDMESSVFKSRWQIFMVLTI